MVVNCPECYKQITLTSVPRTPHFSLVCPHCQIRVTVTLQERIGAQERKVYEMCTHTGRFLAEWNPQTTTVTIPYRGKDYEFNLKNTTAWPQRLQSE